MVDVLAATPVYDAGRIIGHIIDRRDGQHEAVLIDGASLGLFNDPDAALRALVQCCGTP